MSTCIVPLCSKIRTYFSSASSFWAKDIQLFAFYPEDLPMSPAVCLYFIRRMLFYSGFCLLGSDRYKSFMKILNGTMVPAVLIGHQLPSVLSRNGKKTSKMISLILNSFAGWAPRPQYHFHVPISLFSTEQSD